MEIGDMSFAVGGVCKEQFEEVQDWMDSDHKAMDNGK